MATEHILSNTAQKRMISNVPITLHNATVNAVISELLTNSGKYEAIDYVYVLNTNKVLVGVVSIKELLTSPKSKKISEIMQTHIVTVKPHTNQERVVYLALSKGIRAVPVVDKEGHFLGVVPYNTILEIFHHEFSNDLLRFGGILHRTGKEFEILKLPILSVVKFRLPWLIIGVIGGFISASVVSGFEAVLSKYILLAAFIPVLAYLSDSVGTQSESLIVRSLALDPSMSIKKYISRELLVAFLLAVSCALMLGFIAYIGWNSLMLGLIVGFSMMLSIIAAVIISTSLPIIFDRLGIDPAFASGPFATLISDIVTLVIYFTVATYTLSAYNI
ncbi:MAG: magnesium transporter [Candidatus Micrarchaeia archaeon]